MTITNMVQGRFLNTSNGHNKWWEYIYDPITAQLTTRWGKIGSKGQSSTRIVFWADVDRLVAEKRNKGYVMESSWPSVQPASTGEDLGLVGRNTTRKKKVAPKIKGRWVPGKAPIQRHQLRKVEADSVLIYTCIDDFKEFIVWDGALGEEDEALYRFPNNRGVYISNISNITTPTIDAVQFTGHHDREDWVFDYEILRAISLTDVQYIQHIMEMEAVKINA